MFGGCFDVPAILQGRKNNRCTRHPLPRPSLHQVWHRRASMFNQDQPRDSKNVPTVLQSQTQDMPSCCFNHGGAGEQVLGESSQNFIDFTVHFIWQRKSPFLQNLLWIYGSLRTADRPGFSPSKKQIFAEKQRPKICLWFTG